VQILSQTAECSIEAHGSRGFSISGLRRSEQAHVAFAVLAPDGAIGRHAATVPQLFVVAEGSGWDAVLWDAGEEHEAGTDAGLAALIVESGALA